MNIRCTVLLLLAAGVCVHMAHAAQNQVDLYADNVCTGTPTGSYVTDDFGICKDNAGSTSAMMFCTGSGATSMMTLVTFTTTGCDRSHVDFAKVLTADGLATTNTCTATPDNTKGLRALCAATALPKTFNRILFDPTSATCASAAATQSEAVMPNGGCFPAPGGSGSMNVWCGDSNDIITTTYASTDCTGATAAITVLQKDNCGALTIGASTAGLKVTCNVGDSKNVWNHYNSATCDGVPSDTIIGDNGKCYNSTDDTTSMLTFYKNGKVHTSWWNAPSCDGAATVSKLYASSTCVQGETAGQSWYGEMHADIPSSPRVKVEHFYSSSNCGGGSTNPDTTDNDNNGACFDHASTTTSVQAWCSQDRRQGIVSLFSATGCGLPNHAVSHDFQSGVCVPVPGSATESIKITCGATAATLSALVLALPLMLAAWLRNAA